MLGTKIHLILPFVVYFTAEQALVATQNIDQIKASSQPLLMVGGPGEGEKAVPLPCHLEMMMGGAVMMLAIGKTWHLLV